MIIKVDSIPKFEKVDHSAQREQVRRDIEDAIFNHYDLFEIVDDSYDYDSLYVSVDKELKNYICEKYVFPMWEKYGEELSTVYNTKFKLDLSTARMVASRYYTVHSVYDREMSRKRVFVSLDIDTSSISKNLNAVKERMEKTHKEKLLHMARFKKHG